MKGCQIYSIYSFKNHLQPSQLIYNKDFRIESLAFATSPTSIKNVVFTKHFYQLVIIETKTSDNQGAKGQPGTRARKQAAVMSLK